MTRKRTRREPGTRAVRSVSNLRRARLDQVRRHRMLRDSSARSLREARQFDTERLLVITLARGHGPACRRGVVGVCGAGGVHRQAHHATGREPVLARAIRRRADVTGPPPRRPPGGLGARMLRFVRIRAGRPLRSLGAAALAGLRILLSPRSDTSARRSSNGWVESPGQQVELGNDRRPLARLDAGVSNRGRAARRRQGHGVTHLRILRSGSPASRSRSTRSRHCGREPCAHARFPPAARRSS